MTEQADDRVVERFRPTSGRVSGVLGMVTAGVVLVLAVVGWDGDTTLGVVLAALLGALLVWAALLRPALWATERDLVMRGMFHTDRVPLAAIARVRVTQVLTVAVGDRALVSPVVGYTLRRMTKNRFQPRDRIDPNGGASGAPPEAREHQAFVEARITHLAGDARERAGIRPGSPEQQRLAADVRRSWAWPELAACAALTAALLVWLLAR